jgi:hypothetical protein
VRRYSTRGGISAYVVRADAGQGLAQFGEAVGAFEELAHDEGGPWAVEEGEEPGHTALGKTGIGHFSRVTH